MDRIKPFIYWIFLLVFSLNVSAQTYLRGEIYIKLSDISIVDSSNPVQKTSSPLFREFERFGVTKYYFPFKSIQSGDLNKILRVSYDPNIDPNEFIFALNNLAEVKSVEQIPQIITETITDELNDDNLWVFGKINMVNSWNYHNTGSKVVIAVVDNAIRTTHESIKNNLWININEIEGNGIDDDNNGIIDDISGADLADGDNNPGPPANVGPDYFSHGTHVCALATASAGTTQGVVSIGLNTQIIPVKVVPDNAPSDQFLTHAFEGLAYAISLDPDIINLSWGLSVESQILKNLIQECENRGILVFAAAGNENSNIKIYPAAFPYVVGVGATDNQDIKQNQSNYGPSVDLVAPGDLINSAIGTGDNAYGLKSGTSMASPIVASFAGLLLSQYPEYKHKIIEYIKLGCDNIDAINPSYANQLGSGRINVDRTFDLISQFPTLNIDKNINQSVFLAPNPLAGNKINIISLSEIKSVSVFNSLGQTISFHWTKSQIEFDKLATGLYFVNLTDSENQTYTIKIIKP